MEVSEMYYSGDNENMGQSSFGSTPPIPASPDNSTQYTPENYDQSAPAGAPAERFDAPVLDIKGSGNQGHENDGRERLFTHQPEVWREPAYSQTHETTTNMYTPGICSNQAYPRRRDAEPEQVHRTRQRTGRLGRFLRAACLVILCAAFSGAAAYGVMDYRFNRGDFKVEVSNQVVIGGAGAGSQQGGLSTPIATTGVGMTAEEIYIMACSQVVSIKTEVENTGSIFGGNVPGTTTASSGSGFIISSDGYILTNYHVVEAAYRYDLSLVVVLKDTSEYPAKVIGFDVNNDVAVIKIEAAGLNPAVIGNSDNINVGQTIYAVGNPFGELVYTMTDGIVSAIDRVVSVEGKSINAFQFSAAVNSGNSGGPVYDTNGEVIGIVTAKSMRNAVEGIGFAIPINDAIGIAAELIEHGYITGKPLIGITVESVSRAHAEFYGFVEGAYVRSVSPDSAAEKAGILFRDIIVGLGDSEVDSRETLVFLMRRYKAGDTETITVWRGGEEIELTITFDEDLTAGQPRQQQPQQQPVTPTPG